MASLTGSTISSSYEQLLTLPDGGGNGTSYVQVTDGDGGTEFGIKLSTTGASFPAVNIATYPERILHIGYESPYYGVLIQAAGAGWARGYNFGKHSDLSMLGQFGAVGTDDALLYMFIGDDWENTTITFNPANKRVGIGTTSPAVSLDVRGRTYFGGPHYMGKTDVSIASGILNITSTQGPFIAAIAEQGVGSNDADTITSITIDGAEPAVGSMIYLTRSANDVITLTCGGGSASTIICNYSESDDEAVSNASSVVISSSYEVVQLLYTAANRWTVMNPSAVRTND